MTASTLPDVPLTDDEAREISRAAKQARAFTERRNQLIRDALDKGAGVREVARAAEMSPAGVHNLISPRKRT